MSPRRTLVPEPSHARPARVRGRHGAAAVVRSARRLRDQRPHHAARRNADGLRSRADDVDGRLTDFYVGADYGFGERMAVGLAYNRVSMNLGAIEDQGFNARIDWGYDGFAALFQVRSWRQLALLAQIDSNIASCRLG